MAVGKKIGKQAKPVAARTKRTQQGQLNLAPSPVKSATTVIDPVIESVRPTLAQQTEPVLTEVVSYSEPETTVQVNKAPTMRSLVVGLIGAGIGGFIAYTGLKSVFLDKGYSQDEANRYAMYSAGVIGLLTFGLLYKIAKN